MVVFRCLFDIVVFLSVIDGHCGNIVVVCIDGHGNTVVVSDDIIFIDG